MKEFRQVFIKKVTFEQRFGKIRKQATWISRKRVFQGKTRRQEHTGHISVIARRPVWVGGGVGGILN